MKPFFNSDVLLSTNTAIKLYNCVKHLPIIDYHCHLDQTKIADNYQYNDIGEMWLAADHYKWRAMRLCGVNEEYITGAKSYREKFFAYSKIMPMLIGNPLYYWTHMELKQVFDIDLPLNETTAEQIYNTANITIKKMNVKGLLQIFNVNYIATTDDAIDNLQYHSAYEEVLVAPTFRPDKLFDWSEDYLNKLGEHDTLAQLKQSLIKRIDYFCTKGCKIADHGFENFPLVYASDERAAMLFLKRKHLTLDEKSELFGHMLIFFAKEYRKRNIVMQLHFSVTRNVNSDMFKSLGVDSGLDVISDAQSPQSIIRFLNSMTDDERPCIILYTLNASDLRSIAALSGAFKNVIIGAAWWFNDTLEGIRDNLKTISEYAVLGTNLGMLTDSRSFSSYSRFDFFRRILCDFIGDKVERGEYDINSAENLAKNISYYNIKNLLNL